MNEAETRAEHIDPALKAAGWGVVEGSRVRREVPITPGRIEGLGRRGKGLTADYVLEYRNTKLAVIEAKAWNAALTEGVAQAKNYAGKLAVRFTYATNGQGIYAIDMQSPDTRKKLLQGLAEKGFGHGQLAEMQKIIDAEKSDLFEVLAHVAYAMPPVTREARASGAKARIDTSFNDKQRTFLDFVLQHYVNVGVEELDQEKLTPLLRLRYHDSIADAVADLGAPEEIGQVFAGFQKFLYEPRPAAAAGAHHAG